MGAVLGEGRVRGGRMRRRRWLCEAKILVDWCSDSVSYQVRQLGGRVCEMILVVGRLDGYGGGEERGNELLCLALVSFVYMVYVGLPPTMNWYILLRT